jgi:hypothetical protein
MIRNANYRTFVYSENPFLAKFTILRFSWHKNLVIRLYQRKEKYVKSSTAM